MLLLTVTVLPASTKNRPLPTFALPTPRVPSPRNSRLPALTVNTELAGPLSVTPLSNRMALTDLLAVNVVFAVRRTLLVGAGHVPVRHVGRGRQGDDRDPVRAVAVGGEIQLARVADHHALRQDAVVQPAGIVRELDPVRAGLRQGQARADEPRGPVAADVHGVGHQHALERAARVVLDFDNRRLGAVGVDIAHELDDVGRGVAAQQQPPLQRNGPSVVQAVGQHGPGVVQRQGAADRPR